MRPHLSVLMLLARSTIYKVLGLLLALALVEGALFHLALVSNGSGDSGFVSLERAFAQSRIPIVFGVCFLVMTILIERTGHAPGSKQEYTLWRLSVSERSVFAWQALYNTSCYIMLWAAQLFVALALCRLYLLRTNPAFTSHQTVLLAFYRNNFLHSLLPLDEVSRWVSNVAVIIGVGVTSASVPFERRRGKAGRNGEDPLGALRPEAVMDYDGRRLAVAGFLQRKSGHPTCDFYLAVYDESGLAYYAEYLSSLSRGDEPGWHRGFCEPVDYHPIGVTWD